MLKPRAKMLRMRLASSKGEFDMAAARRPSCQYWLRKWPHCVGTASSIKGVGLIPLSVCKSRLRVGFLRFSAY